jgi:5-formyltetrahydrofolate cyclo-ligase
MIPFRHPFKISIFGTKESFKSIFYKQNIDLMVVPIIGFDSMNRRIGFGKGMYDRFFDKLSKKPIIIFVQLDKIFSKPIITQSFDIKFNIYISAKTIIKKK